MPLMAESTHLFVTADDRTGALEIGGVIANEDFSVPVGPNALGTRCRVVDLGSRHLSAEAAFERTRIAHTASAQHRCHKMDSGMRGRWPHEVRALVELGYEVAVVPSYPDAGRRCTNGVVYINDVPVLESSFGADPLSAPVSNKPIEVLDDAGCLSNAIAVWDASDNQELRAAIARCREEQRVLVGPTGAIEIYARTVFPKLCPRAIELTPPVLIVCGSLNQVSRSQLQELELPLHSPSDELNDASDVVVLATQVPDVSVTLEQAQDMARTLALIVQGVSSRFQTLVVIGGDTAAALVRDSTLEVLGCVDTGIPISRFNDRLLVTKGGAIGDQNTLVKLCKAFLRGNG